MCAHSVGKPFHALHRSGGMKEFTLERNLTNVMTVVSPLRVTLVSEYIKQPILE